MSYSLKITNHAGYTGKVLGSYTSQGKTINFDTSDIYALQIYNMNFPEDAANVDMVAFYYDTFAGYLTIRRAKFATLTENLCFYLYGTIFNPSFQQFPCTGVGGGKPDIPDSNNCCCCCCCNCKCN